MNNESALMSGWSIGLIHSRRFNCDQNQQCHQTFCQKVDSTFEFNKVLYISTCNCFVETLVILYNALCDLCTIYYSHYFTILLMHHCQCLHLFYYLTPHNVSYTPWGDLITYDDATKLPTFMYEISVSFKIPHSHVWRCAKNKDHYWYPCIQTSIV